MFNLQVKVVIAAKNPKQLADFYARVINGEVIIGEKGVHYCVLNESGTQIQLYRPSRNFENQPKSKALSFCIESKQSEEPLREIDNWLKKMISYGAIEIEKPSMKNFGAEVWLKDPDGNYFLIVVPTK